MNAYDKRVRERIDKMLQMRASVSTSAFGALMIAGAWIEDRHFWAMVALFIGHAIYSTIFGKLSFGRVDRFMPNVAFTIGNTIYALGTIWAFDFQAPSFVVVPLMVLLMDGFSEGDLEKWILGMLAVTASILLLIGAPPMPVAASVLVGWVVHWFSEGRSTVLRMTLLELRVQAELMREVNAELGNIQSKMIGQERLSSLGLMAAGVAHQINNPLAYVSSNVNALAMDIDRLPTDPKLLEEYRTEVIPATIDGVSRVAEIVSALRRFASADPDKKEIFDLDAEVVSAIRVCKGKIEDYCELEVDLEHSLRIEGQPGQICQVVVNLLRNAADSMRSQKGRLRVTARHQGDHVVLAIVDHGEGMTPQVLNRIFEPFFTTKSRGEGPGLGLSVAHGIIRAHGGTIDVESTPGKGTAVTVRLPRAVAKAPAAEAA